MSYMERPASVQRPSFVGLWHRLSGSPLKILVVILTIGITAVGGFQYLASASTVAKVPVVVCPTQFGTSVPTEVAKIPHFEPVTLPPQRAVSVALYTDLAQLQTVLGPRGWECKASYGADGNGGVTIYPEKASIRFKGISLVNDRNLQAVHVEWNAACVGCILDQTCPYFSGARAMFVQFGYSNPDAICVRPRGEVLQRTSANLDFFLDPPGVKGSATPSGGPFPALGMVYWGGPVKLMNGRSGTNGSAIETCTIEQSGTCQESFAYFESHDIPKLTNS
jgi:hypothetical protein